VALSYAVRIPVLLAIFPFVLPIVFTKRLSCGTSRFSLMQGPLSLRLCVNLLMLVTPPIGRIPF